MTNQGFEENANQYAQHGFDAEYINNFNMFREYGFSDGQIQDGLASPKRVTPRPELPLGLSGYNLSEAGRI